MVKKELMVLTVETNTQMSIEEFCEKYHVTPEWVDELISYGIIEQQARLDLKNLHRIRRLLRLQHDLELNVAGAVLALELLDQIKTLEVQVALFQKHLMSSR